MGPLTLQSALKHEPIPRPLPAALPVAHITVARWLNAILEDGELRPRHCTVFGKDLLYFSYGGLFYRPKSLSTQKATEWPIGMVFSPRALDAMHILYPFDTGAMADNPYFEKWNGRLSPFKTRFRIRTRNASNDVPRLVKLLYASNRRYVKGVVSPDAKRRVEPIPLLASFLGADMTPHADHRQRSIECITDSAFALGKHLQWIGVPNRALDRIRNAVFRWTAPDTPVIYPCPTKLNFNPASVAEHLEDVAREVMIDRFLDLER